MTLFYGSDEDGEGFASSAAFRTRVRLVPETRLLWGNHLAHELLHMWNGQQLRGTDQPLSQWLQEGFTEYMSNRALLRTGMISREDFLRKMEYNTSLSSYFRLHSGGRKTLNDYMAELYRRTAARDVPWTWDDLIITATSVAGADMTPFFSRYVAGLEAFPLESELERLGLTLMGQSYAAEM